MSDSVCEMTTDTHIAMQSCHFSFFAPSGVVADRTASASVAICFAATSSCVPKDRSLIGFLSLGGRRQ